MARFTKSNSSKDSRSSPPRGRSRGRPSSSRDSRDSRDSRYSRSGGSKDFQPKRFSRNRRDVKMTKVTCAACGVLCEVPFNPTSNKPVYCSDCFRKQDKNNTKDAGLALNVDLEEELEIINKKLDKIMKFLGA